MGIVLRNGPLDYLKCSPAHGALVFVLKGPPENAVKTELVLATLPETSCLVVIHTVKTY